MKPLLVVVTGPDGVGKSTVVSGVAHRLGADAVEAGIWDALDGILSHVDARALLADLGHLSRAYLLLHGVARSIELAERRRPKVILVDGYWYKYAASELEHGAPAALFADCAEVFPKPDLVFHLDLSVEDALLRKRSQSAYERGFGDGDRAFLDFQHRVRGRWMVLAATQGPWRRLDAALPERDLVDTVVAAVRERL